MAEAAVLHTATAQLLQESVQHSLKNQATHDQLVTHAHRQVAPATAKCVEVAQTMVATGHQKVVPTASHATVQLVLQLVHLATAILVRHVTTVLLVVNLVHAMTVRLVLSMATAHRVVILDQTVRLVHSVTATLVRHVTTALLVVNLVHAMTVRLVHSMANVQLAHLMEIAHRVVISVHAMTVRLVHSVTATHVRVATLVQTAQRVRLVPTVMVVAQTA
jgi:hypothetical protein